MPLESLQVTEGCSGQWKAQAQHSDLEVTLCQRWERAGRSLSYVPFVSESMAFPMATPSAASESSANPGQSRPASSGLDQPLAL